MILFDIRWSTFATQQIAGIYDYFIKTSGKTVAVKVVKGIIEAAEVLRKAPALGQQETLLKDKGADYRYLIHGNYKLIYKHDILSGQVHILDVFDTRQNPKKIKRYK